MAGSCRSGSLWVGTAGGNPGSGLWARVLPAPPPKRCFSKCQQPCSSIKAGCRTMARALQEKSNPYTPACSKYHLKFPFWLSAPLPNRAFVLSHTALSIFGTKNCRFCPTSSKKWKNCDKSFEFTTKYFCSFQKSALTSSPTSVNFTASQFRYLWLY